MVGSTVIVLVSQQIWPIWGRPIGAHRRVHPSGIADSMPLNMTDGADNLDHSHFLNPTTATSAIPGRSMSMSGAPANTLTNENPAAIETKITGQRALRVRSFVVEERCCVVVIGTVPSVKDLGDIPLVPHLPTGGSIGFHPHADPKFRILAQCDRPLIH